MLPCHCKLIKYLLFFEVCTYPSIHNFGLDLRLPRCNVISEGRLPLSNTGSEPDLCPKRYVSRMTRTEYFLSKNSFIFFWKPLFSTFYVTLSLSAENIFTVFRSLHLPLDTHFWTRGFLLVMRSRKAGLPLATQARKRELCPKRYVSRMTRTEYFLSQNSFIVF